MSLTWQVAPDATARTGAAWSSGVGELDPIVAVGDTFVVGVWVTVTVPLEVGVGCTVEV